MGIFQRYLKKDRSGKTVIGKNGKPVRTGPWFIQYPHARNPKTGDVQYKTLKASWHKKKAREILLKKQEEFYLRERLGEAPKKETTFAELIDWGLSQEVMKAKATARDDVVRAEHLKTAFGMIKAGQVTPLMVDNFRIKMKKTKSSRTKRPFSGGTVNKFVSLARRIYYLAMDEGLVTSNPFARRGHFKEHTAGKYIPDQEFRAIHKNLPGFLQPVALTAYLSGMRAGEVTSLTWDKVDLQEGIIDLSAEDTKTDEPRLIYLSALPELEKTFAELALEQRRGRRLVFTKSDGSAIPVWALRRPFLDACKNAKVGPYRFHDLRHTFNTNMVKAGVKKSVIMKLTGHKTLSMFLRYSHLDREQSESAMERLGQLLTSGSTYNPGEAAAK